MKQCELSSFVCWRRCCLFDAGLIQKGLRQGFGIGDIQNAITVVVVVVIDSNSIGILMIPAALLAGHERQEGGEDEDARGLHDRCDEEGVGVVVLVRQPATEGGAAAPSEDGDGIKGLPARAFRLGDEVHEDALLQRVGSVHEAGAHDVDGNKDEGMGVEVGLEEDHGVEAGDACRAEDELGLHAADALATAEQALDARIMTTGTQT
eukprot:CAMPEP_0198112740 /NCGR_PEP_ID=MMETSP1442-20131203/4544_1 /TAXON_ID= /ORGANISM="Craspedostauros australis, Strain CCMP3328" /LENGTH=206 /DNA_ID=CAMNT_0043769631 /DNA_START=70 /DNA_END=691 /DNA_ORIENTATION=-